MNKRSTILLVYMTPLNKTIPLSSIHSKTYKKQHTTSTEEIFQDMAETFKSMSDTTRLKILYILSKQHLCVCDIAEIVNMSISAVSHQLRILRDKKLVKYKKQGKCALYSLDDDHVVQLLTMAYEHVMEG
jgi:ArsR family transcriptional regulator, lead/cadmium/zinc/bismuth-responsive transcriptional repressor